MDLALSRPLPIARLDKQAVLVRTNRHSGAGHDIPARAGVPDVAVTDQQHTLWLSSAHNEPALEFVPPSAFKIAPCGGCSSWEEQGAADEEKDPGSAFGPKSIPLATGLVSVVYWVPGPFPGPTPVQPDERRSPIRYYA